MGLFRGMFKGRLSPLITCIVQWADGAWDISWVADGRAPGEFSDETLTRATARASAEVAAMYSGRVESSAAELQFAIYPWGGDGGRIILDITPDAEGYVARALQGSDISVRAETLEGLVERAEQSLGDTSGVMLRWIRSVSTIPS
jgi:hypothetical protein